MKTRGAELAIDRPATFSFLAALKFLLLAALVVLFLNATASLYADISVRYYANPSPPFLRISSSSVSSPSRAARSSSESESVSSLPPVSDSPASSLSSFEASSSSSSSSNSSSSPVPSISNKTSSSSSLSSSSSAYLTSTTPQPPPISPSPTPISLIISSAETILSVPDPSPPLPILEKPPSSNHSDYLNSPSSSSSSSPPATLNRNSDTGHGGGKRRGIPKGCDLSKGEWIRDPNAPYYTNSTCWTIQEHQNCMKYGRPDLDFLKWRWKPDGCELPLLDPGEFLQLMRGKSMAFIGDSLARNQMQSLLCLLSRVEYPQEILPEEENVTQMLYKSFNFTVWTFWSPFLVRAEETMTREKYGMWDIYIDEPDPLWQPRLGLFDHVVLNTGNWYTRPAQFHEKRRLIGCHYCVVKKVPFMSVYKAHRRAFRAALDAIVGNGRGFAGVTVVRTVSPSHFEGGEWNGGGDCRRTGPLRRGGARLRGMDLELYRDQLREFWKAKWEGSERGMEFRLLDTTQAMLMRPDGHPSRYGHWPEEERVLYNDCVHWCLPGPADMWNDFLFQVLSIS